MSQRSYTVRENCELLPFLIATLGSCSRTTVKSYLTHRQVEVNRRIVSQFNAPLRAGDDVTIFRDRRSALLSHPMLRILHEDEAVVVVDKASGLLSIGTQKERTRTAFYILSEHVKRTDPAARIFIVHRLDRDTSGLMVFAKSEDVKRKMQLSWNETVRERAYTAVVEGRLSRKEGVVSARLAENKGHKVFVTDDADAQQAVTHYRVLRESGDYSLLELHLETGRKNQIRAHMEYIGHSVAGDAKYGASDNPIGRVALHASRLCFVHPVSGRPMDFSLPLPAAFGQMMS